ncbi:MAG TPA: hypothetical protein VJI46_02605 [Candidatus Nanoarchaeia archaeon]|nr:hypothetical protein [Candidatus Nanoarchaeia archaeon]
MRFGNIIRIMVGAALATKLFVGEAAYAQETYQQPDKKDKVELNLGYNALEVAVTDKADVRTRALTNVDATIGDRLTVGYHGLNEMDNADPSLYYGRHVITAAPKDSQTSAAAVVKTDSAGVFDKKVGIRNTSLPEMLGSYGFIEVTANGDATNLTAFYGREVGPIIIEGYQDVDVPFKGKVSSYSELILTKSLDGKLSVFGRAEIPNNNPKETKGMIGFVFPF